MRGPALHLLLPLALLLAACPASGGDDDDDGGPVPELQHNAVTVADEGVPVAVDCVASPPEGRESEGLTLLVTLNHRAVGAATWTTATLDGDGTAFTGTIPAEAVTADGVEYWLQAIWADAVGTHPRDYPDSVHSIEVTPAPLASPAPVRARLHDDTIELTWSPPGTVTFTGYEVVAELDSGGSATVCSGATPETGCSVPVAGTYDTGYATWTVTFTGESGTTEASAVTDGLHLVQDVWGKEHSDQEVAFGTGAGEFNLPLGVTVRGTRVFVAEQTNNRIQQFTTEGTQQGSFGAGNGDGTAGSGNGEFSGPSDVVEGPDGKLYVADFTNARVQVIDASNGAWQSEFGGIGTAEGQLRFPSSLAFDAAGNLHVVETVNARVSVFDPDGAFIDAYDRVDGHDLVAPSRIVYVPWLDSMAVSDGPSLYLRGPAGDATWDVLDAAGSAVVAGACVTAWDELVVTVDDSGQTVGSAGHRLVKLDRDGAQIGAWGEWGVAEGRFFRPVDCAVDANGSVFVADGLNHRIQVLGP